MEQIIITKPDTSTYPLVERGKGEGISSATQTMELNGVDVVNISVQTTAPKNYGVGDKVVIFGRTYRLNRLPRMKKISAIHFQYDLEFEGIQYNLLRVTYDLTVTTTSNQIQDFQADTLTGSLQRFGQVLLSNISRVFPGGWELGDCPETAGDVTLTFNESDNCLSVLQNLCTQFNVEYEIVWNEITEKFRINFKSQVGQIFPITFKFGRGSGLYELERQNVDSSNIITRLKVFGSSQNITSKYRAARLCLPDKIKSQSYIEDATAIAKYGVFEATKYFEDIKPTFNGRVTSLGANVLTFADTSMFDLNEKEVDGVTTKYLLPGMTAKIHFNTGNLAGYEFDVHSYDHSTHTFVINKITDDRGDSFPSDVSAAFKIGIGDKYKILDVALPDSYVEAAESDLEDAGETYFEQNSQPKVQYSLSVDNRFLKQIVSGEVSTNVFMPGDYIPVEDGDIDVNKSVRVKSFVRDILKELTYNLTLTDLPVSVNLINRIISDQIDLNKIIKINNLADVAKARRNWIDLQELLAKIFDPEGHYYTEKIKPLSIDTMALAVGAKSMQFILSGTILEPNYLGNANDVNITGGVLSHYSIDPTKIVEWNLADSLVTGLDPDTAYYVYAKAQRSGSGGTIIFSDSQIIVDEDPNYYHFWLGVLNSVKDGVRALSLTYGFTMINGRFITTGRIQSLDGNNFFDLDENKFKLGGSQSGLDWNVTQENRLTIRGGIVANSGGISEPLGVYRGTYNPAATYYKGDTVTYAGSLYQYINDVPASGKTPEEGAWWTVKIQKGATGLGTTVRVIYRKNTDADNAPDLDVDDPDPADWSLQMPQIDTQWLLGTEEGDYIVGHDGEQYLTTVDGEYIWASTEVLKEDNTFDHWSAPTRISGRNGIPNEYTEYRFQKNGSPTNPPVINKTDPDPALWAIEMPVITSADFVWMVKANKLPDGTLVSAWSDPVRVNGVDGGTVGQGDPGPFMMFRGEWNKDGPCGDVVHKQYSGNSEHIDAVRYNGDYYVARTDAGNIPVDTLPTDTDYWNGFVGQFESVATGLFLANIAYINNLGVNYLRTREEGSRIEIKGMNQCNPVPEQNDNTMIFYDENSKELLRIDDDIDSDYVSGIGYTSKAGIRVSDVASGRVAYATGNGIFSNASKVQFLAPSTGIKTNASVAGILFERNDSSNGLSAAVAGIDATSSGNSKSYGGFFNSLKVAGVAEIDVMNIGGMVGGNLLISTYNAAGIYLHKSEMFVTTYHTAGNQSVFLPAGDDLKPGRLIFFKRINDGGMTLMGNGNSICMAGNTIKASNGMQQRMLYVCFWDGSYWQLGAF